MKLRCQSDYEICGHTYNPEQGYPENGINPGTPLKDIPDDWICPRCRTDVIEPEQKGEN